MHPFPTPVAASPLQSPRHQRPIPWYWVLVPALLGLLYLALPFQAVHQAPWTGLWLNHANGRAFVAKVAAGSPADRSGIRPGDTLIRLQGQPMPHLAAVRDRDYLDTWAQDRDFWIGRHWLDGKVRKGVPVEIRLKRSAQVMTASVVPVDAPWIPILKRTVLIQVSGLIFLVVGLFVAVRTWNTSSRLNLLAGLGVCVTALTLAGFNSRDLAFPVGIHHFLQISNEISVMFLAAAYAHFSWLFPRPHPMLKRRPWLPWTLWGGTLLCAGAHFLELSPGPLMIPNGAILVAGLFLLVSVVTGAPSLKSQLHRRQLQVFVIGLVCAILPIVLLTLIPLLMGLPFVPEEVSTLGTILAPLGMAISISRWRLIELPMLLARALSTLLSLAVLILGAALALQRIDASPDMAALRPIATGLLVLLAAVLHPPLKRLLFRILQGLGKAPQPGVDMVLEHFLHRHAEGQSVQESLEHTLRERLHLPILDSHPWLEDRGARLQAVMEGRSRPLSGEELSELLAEDVPGEIEACVLIGLGKPARTIALGPRWNPDGWTRGDMEILGALCAIATPLVQAQEARSHAEELRRQQLEEAKVTLEHRVEERTRELEKANVDLSQALLAREDFLAAMSHELRTPLSTVLGAGEAILAGVDGEPTPAMQERLGAMLRNGRHLRELIGDVLDFARGRAGRLPVQRIPFGVEEVCREAVDLVRSRSGREEQVVEIRFPDLPTGAVGDPLRVRQILTNLLANALHHGGGPVELELEADGAQVRLRVLDRGAGIPTGKAERLFQAFDRLDRDHAGGVGGSGLGLALSHMLAGLMDGSLEYRPREGGGSCFELTLPWSAEIPSDADSSSDGGSDEEAGHLVLVEDHDELRELLEDYFAAQGWTLEVFSRAQPALEACAARMPDVLLTDLGLPGVSGIELVRQVRELPQARGLRVIVLTGQVMPEDTRSCLEAGADAVLPKPFPLARLDRLLRELPVRPGV